jgi:hypothetical protein
MYNINSGEIQDGVLYLVYGTQSVLYNGNTYASGQYFRGVTGVTDFSFSGDGTQLVYETLEFKGGALEFITDGQDLPVFGDQTVINGAALEFEQTAADAIFNDATSLDGASVEMMESAGYSFMITETRL